MIGLAVVSVALIAIVQLSTRALAIQTGSRLSGQASRLEQEAMEAIRQIRDGYGKLRVGNDLYDWDWTNADDVWVTEVNTPGCTPNCVTYFRLYFDTTTNYWELERLAPTSPLDSAYRLNWRNNKQEFGYNNRGGFGTGSPDSPFYRQISMQDIPPEGAFDPKLSKTITATLSWRQDGHAEESKLVSILSRW